MHSCSDGEKHANVSNKCTAVMQSLAGNVNIYIYTVCLAAAVAVAADAPRAVCRSGAKAQRGEARHAVL